MIIVGATHGATAGYRADADRAYAEAIKYTPNVVKVYSPNATWAKVKAAVVGASIVIYMGHGNGWPSPYTYDPEYTTKDGFGLNATAGNGDYNNMYYGEPFVSTLDLAPGAIVLLTTCATRRATRNPATPSRRVTVARQRADNYAAGLPEGRCRRGHRRRARRRRGATSGPCSRPTSRSKRCGGRCRTRTATSRFPSARTPGATVFQDPNRRPPASTARWPSGPLGATTDEVVAGGTATRARIRSACRPRQRRRSPPTARPSSSGRARSPEPRRPCRPGPGCGSSSSRVQTAATGERRWSKSSGIDDPSIGGFMRARPTWPPVTARLRSSGCSTLAGRSRPNGDGQLDTTTICGRFTEIRRPGRCGSATAPERVRPDRRAVRPFERRLGRPGRGRSRRRRHVLGSG